MEVDVVEVELEVVEEVVVEVEALESLRKCPVFSEERVGRVLEGFFFVDIVFVFFLLLF